jgi:hypothetical protein
MKKKRQLLERSQSMLGWMEVSRLVVFEVGIYDVYGMWSLLLWACR